MKIKKHKVKGYASVFGNVDASNDVVEKTAFDNIETFKDLPLLYQHGESDILGKVTKGTITKHGLYIEAEIYPDLSKSQEVLKLIGYDFTLGFSIGYNVKRTRRETNPDIRYIEEMDELAEISIVTAPCNPLCIVGENK